jgi:hypothetical protein
MVEDEDTDARAGARADVEPLFAALRAAPPEEGAKTLRAGRSHLGWKLVWAALVLLALLAIVLNQAF